MNISWSFFIVGSVIVLIFVLAASLRMLLDLIKIGPNGSRQARKMTGGFKNALQGKVGVDPEGIRNYSVSRGMVFNKKTKRVEERGFLSDDYIASVKDT